MSPHLLEGGAPAADPRAFRRCLGQFATGVTVMTASDGDTLAGMSVNSFAALSLDPPLVLWSIRRESASVPLFRRATHYAVNVLAADQVDLSVRFATPAADRFAQTDWSPGLGGAPLLGGCVAHFECRLHQVIEGGDHLILVGQVERYARLSGEPLLFAQGRYAVAQEHPGHGRPGAGDGQAPTGGFPFDVQSASLMRLVNYASHQLSTCFDAYREDKGLGMAQVRLFGWLRSAPRTLEELVSLTYLGQREVCDAVHELRHSGHLVARPDGRLDLSAPGRERADAMARSVAAFEQDLVKSLPPAELGAMRRALVALAALASGEQGIGGLGQP